MGIGDDLGKGVGRGRWSEEEAEAALRPLRDRDRTSKACDGCELVIEAAPERLELKREIFTALAGEVGPGPSSPATPPRCG